MTISQSKIGEIEKKVYQEEQDSEIYKKCNKKGHGLKTVVSDFLPEVRAQSVRFTLLLQITEQLKFPTLGRDFDVFGHKSLPSGGNAPR